MYRRGGIFGWLTLVTMGVIIADIEAHPAGAQAGFNGLSSILGTSFSAVLGGKKVNG